MNTEQRLLAWCAVGLMLAGSPWAANVEPMPLEQRKAVMSLPGMCSIEPAERWEGGIVTGNGIMGASVLGQPYEEKIIFNHERLFRPFLDERPLPPKISGAVPEVRRMIREGKSNQALEHWRKVMVENGHPRIVNTPPYHPAYTMHITRPDAGDVTGYLRIVDFMTGEAVVRYHDNEGAWIHRTFVSRADNVVVQWIGSPEGRPFSADLKLVDQWHGLKEEHARITTDLSPGWMIARCKYKTFWCPNTDVLCALPGMISEALVYSKPGVIEFLPAWAPALPAGSIEGIRCRNLATVESLGWDLGKREINATITSPKSQWITVFARQGIRSLMSNHDVQPSEHVRIARKVLLPADTPVKLEIVLEGPINDHPVNAPAFTLEEAERLHAERIASREAKKKQRK